MKGLKRKQGKLNRIVDGKLDKSGVRTPPSVPFLGKRHILSRKAKNAHAGPDSSAETSLGAQKNAHKSTHTCLGAQVSAHKSFGAQTSGHKSAHMLLGAHTSSPLGGGVS